MILQSLVELYDRLSADDSYGIPPFGYSVQKITFKIVLRPDGTLFDIQDARQNEAGKLRPQRVLVPGQAKSPGSGINPGFLWDNTAYLLGYDADPKKRARALRAFEGFRDRHLRLNAEIDAPAFSAVCAFLANWDAAAGHAVAAQFPVLEDTNTGFGLFQIQGESGYVHDVPKVRAWWADHREVTSEGFEAQCLVTGEYGPIAKTHSPKIKGVAGAQSAGATLVSFEPNAFRSYGKEQSHNAPVSESAAFRYATGLNALLEGPMRDKHRIQLGATTVVFWTDKPSAVEDCLAQYLRRGSSDAPSRDVQDEAMRSKLEMFFIALRSGRGSVALDEDPDRTAFYLLGLAPNAARVSVRFFHQGMVGELLDNLKKHHDDTGIEPQPASAKRRADPEFPSHGMLLDQTCPTKRGKPDREKIPPVLAGPLLRAVLQGMPYPQGLFTAVIRRIHADRLINYPRACVLKGYLVRNRHQEVSMSLDLENTSPAYRLGRAFAALEKTQKDALGGKLNKTIRDSYYSSASATPRTVFPRLLRTYQHHLAKLEGGRRINRERLLQEVLDPLDSFPAHFNLEEQGLFALGYYHQTRALYTKRDDHTDQEGDSPA